MLAENKRREKGSEGTREKKRRGSGEPAAGDDPVTTS